MQKRENRNNWQTKIKRTLTSILPINKEREGGCINCGECCKLPNVCPFLRFKSEGESYCSIHVFRPLNCRKYPRDKAEWVTERICGYKFN